MIVLKWLNWDNMFCYGENNLLNFEESNVTQIVGKNGAGKSSINLILEELLFNKNSKGIKKADILNRESGADYYMASAELEVDGAPYHVTLTRRGATSKLLLFKDGEDISSHTATNTYKQLAEILGDDFSTFSQKVYQGMTSSLQFLTATDAARKKFLISLLDLTEYAEYEAQIKEYSTGLTGEIKELGKAVDTLSTLVTTATADKALPLKELVEVPEVSEALPDELVDLKVVSNDLTTHNKTVKRRIVLTDLLSELEVGELLEASNEDFTSLIATAVAGHKANTAFILKMKKLDKQCPTCLSQIDQEHVDLLINDYTKSAEENHAKKAEYQEKKDEIDRVNRHNRTVVKAQEDKEIYQKELDSLPVHLSEPGLLSIEGIATKIAEIKATIKVEADAITAANASNVKIAAQNAKVEAAISQWTLFSESLAREVSRLDTLKSELGKLEVLKKAFSSKGIVAFKIESLVKDLENTINDYLIEFSSGRFSLHFVLESDKLNIVISDKGRDVSIAALSSGELARVNISTVLAIRKLMSSNSKNNVNLLFLDEISNVLDVEGREKLVQILMRETTLNTFIISHGWQHPLVPRLEVTKTNNIATIQEA